MRNLRLVELFSLARFEAHAAQVPMPKVGIGRRSWISNKIVTGLIAVIAYTQPANAGGDTSGTITSLQTYFGHSGTLVRLNTPGINPDSCFAGSAWYIYPDSSIRAQLGQSMLLSSQLAGKAVSLHVDGCVEGYPKIVVITIP